MLFAFILSLVPLLVAAETAVPNAKGKVTNFKPESWMLKPLSPSDEHYKPAAHSVSSTYVNDYTYWFIQAYYSSTGMYCNSDDLIMKTALPSYTCMPTGDFTSIMIQCWSEYTCYFYEYSDNYCGTMQTSNYVNLYICQAGDADDDGYVTDDGNQYTSQQLMVQQGFPVPLPGNSTTLSFYDSMYCDPSTMNNYRLAYPNKCYNNFNGTSRTSTQYVNPNLLSYNDNGCDMANVAESMPFPPGVCQVDYTTSPATSSMLVLNFPKPPVVPVNTAAIVGAT
eukprot:gene12085-14004_t